MPLTGLRGVAALTVALGHYAIADLFSALSIFYWYNAAVDLFFCLSGFALCLAYDAGRSARLGFRNYLVARIARIFPLYFILFLATSLLVNWHEGRELSRLYATIGDFVRQATMTNAWSLASDGVHWNTPSWSVSVEFFCYLFVFPALFYAPRALWSLGWRIRLSAILLASALSLFVYLRSYDARILFVGRNPAFSVAEIAYSVNLLRGILGFLAGWMVYISYASRDVLARAVSKRVDLISLFFVVLLIAAALGSSSFQAPVVLFPFLILGAASGSSLTARFLSWKPLHYLGKISYSLYLIHYPWFMLVPSRLSGRAPSNKLLYFIIFFGGMLVVSALSYHLVEMPLRRLVRLAFQSRTVPDRFPAGRLALLRSLLIASVLIAGGAEAARIGLFDRLWTRPVVLGEEIVADTVFARVAVDGWSERENWGVWTQGKDAQLDIPLAAGPRDGLRLSLKGDFFLTERHRAVNATLLVDDREIAAFHPSWGAGNLDATFALPPDLLADGPGRVRVEIRIDNPVSPKSLGLSEDGRMLGFGLRSLKLLGPAQPERP